MHQVKIGVTLIALMILTACSSSDNTKIYTSEKGNKLTVKDTLIALMLSAPKPKVGENQQNVKAAISSSSAIILQGNDSSVIARFTTQGSQLESLNEYCELEYHFYLSKFTGGPFVIGDCSAIVFKGSKTN